MRFFLDENVPRTVQKVLEDNGHEAVFIREVIAAGSVDELVAVVSEENKAILVSHDSDFKKIAPRIPDGQKARFRRLSMVRMQCKKPRSAERMQVALPYIELEFELRKALKDKRLIVAIKTDVVSVHR